MGPASTASCCRPARGARACRGCAGRAARAAAVRVGDTEVADGTMTMMPWPWRTSHGMRSAGTVTRSIASSAPSRATSTAWRSECSGIVKMRRMPRRKYWFEPSPDWRSSISAATQDVGLSHRRQLHPRCEEESRRAHAPELPAVRRRPGRGPIVGWAGGFRTVAARRGSEDRLHARHAPVSGSAASPRGTCSARSWISQARNQPKPWGFRRSYFANACSTPARRSKRLPGRRWARFGQRGLRLPPTCATGASPRARPCRCARLRRAIVFLSGNPRARAPR